MDDIVGGGNTDNGDSGGVYFWKNSSDEVYIVACHRAGVDEDEDGIFDDCVGNAMYEFEDKFKMTV